MNAREQQELMTRLYQPFSASLAKTLPDLGQALAGVFNDLARDPTDDQCIRALTSLRSAEHVVQRLRAALESESHR